MCHLKKRFFMCWVLVSILLLSGCAKGREDLVESGKNFEKTGNLIEAKLNYEKALQKRPNYGEAHYRLALLAIANSETTEGHRRLKLAAEAMPENLEVQRRLGDLTLSIYFTDSRRSEEMYSTLLAVVERLKRLKQIPALAHRYKGYLELASQKVPEAISSFELARSVDPADEETKFVLAQTYFGDRQDSKGEELLDELLSKHKAFAPAYDLRGARLIKSGNLAQAESILRAKVQNFPKDPVPSIELAQFLRTRGESEAADQLLKQTAESTAYTEDGAIAVGDYFVRTSQSPLALTYYKLAAARGGATQVNAEKREIGTLVGMKNFALARARLDDLVKQHPTDQGFQIVQAYLWLESADRGKLETALNTLQKAAQQGVKEISLHWYLGLAQSALGNHSASANEWQLAAKLNRFDSRPRLALASFALKNGRAEDALGIAEEMISSNPGSLDGLMLKVRALEASGNIPLARQTLSEIRRRMRNPASLAIEDATLMLGEGKALEAEKIFRAELQRTPGSARAVNGLVRSLQMQRRGLDAIKILEAEVRERPAVTPARYLLAEGYEVVGQNEQIVSLMKPLMEAQPPDPLAYIFAAKAYSRMGDPLKAIEILKSSLKVDPTRFESFILLGEAQFQAEKLAEAVATYRSALAAHPNRIELQQSLAYVLAASGADTKEAKTLVENAMRIQPQSAALQDTLGYIYLKDQNLPAARKIFEVLVRKYPDEAIFHYHHALSLKASGDKPEATESLKLALAKNQDRYLKAAIQKELVN